MTTFDTPLVSAPSARPIPAAMPARLAHAALPPGPSRTRPVDRMARTTSQSPWAPSGMMTVTRHRLLAAVGAALFLFSGCQSEEDVVCEGLAEPACVDARNCVAVSGRPASALHDEPARFIGCATLSSYYVVCPGVMVCVTKKAEVYKLTNDCRPPDGWSKVGCPYPGAGSLEADVVFQHDASTGDVTPIAENDSDSGSMGQADTGTTEE